MYFHRSLRHSERSRELKYDCTKYIYIYVGATYMDVAFPYKEAITNAYGLIGHTRTHVARGPAKWRVTVSGELRL